MKEFLKTQINWRKFIEIEIGIFAFLLLSYFAGNNKFPHHIYIVPLGVIVIGIAVILYAYYDYKIKNEKMKNK